MTTNGSGSDWVAMLPVSLSDDEKRCLDAIALLGGSFSTSDGNYPDEVDELETRGFLHRERRGDTYFRGRSRGDGIDLYEVTELARMWLQGCRPAGEGK